MLLMCHTQLAQLKYLPSNFQSLKGYCDGAVSVEREGRRSRTACRRFVTQVWLESLFQLNKVGLVIMQLCFRFKANDDTSTL